MTMRPAPMSSATCTICWARYRSAIPCHLICVTDPDHMDLSERLIPNFPCCYKLGLMRTIVSKGGVKRRVAVLVLSLVLGSGLFLASSCRQGEAPGHEEGSGGSSSHQGHTSRDATKASSKTRTYYIAADEVDWDYAPSGKNQITGEPFGEEENVFVRQGEHRIGKTYRKALYREYTNERFTELKHVRQNRSTWAPWARYSGRR